MGAPYLDLTYSRAKILKKMTLNIAYQGHA
jgi:hypothetical protein